MGDEKRELSRWGLRQCAGYAFGGAVFTLVFWALSELGADPDDDSSVDFLAYSALATGSIALGAIALLVARFGRSWPSWLLTSVSVVIFLLVMFGIVITVLLFGLDREGF